MERNDAGAAISVSPTNELGQPVGVALPGWQPRPHPPHAPMTGRFCRIEPVSATRHAAGLFAANRADPDGRMWTYMPYGPFQSEAAYRDWCAWAEASADPQFYAVVESGADRPVGVASYLRIAPEVGVIEIGHLAYSPALQGTTAATEAIALMLRRAVDELGYRRVEWKCDALNAASRRAALRLGFTFEGVFRQATVTKGRNRDTAWYAIIDRDWPPLRSAFDHWLDPANFDAQGCQRSRLSDLTAAAAASQGPPPPEQSCPGDG